MLLGIPVLQVMADRDDWNLYADDPRHAEPGRVGPAIAEMKLGENQASSSAAPTFFRILESPGRDCKVLRGWFAPIRAMWMQTETG